MLNQISVLSKKERKQKEIYESMVQMTNIIEGDNYRPVRWVAKKIRAKQHQILIGLNS